MYLRKTVLLFSETPELRLYLIIFARADQLCIIASNSANKIVTSDIFSCKYSILCWISNSYFVCYDSPTVWDSSTYQILRFYNARLSLSQLLQDRSALIQVLPHVGAHVFQTKTCATNLQNTGCFQPFLCSVLKMKRLRKGLKHPSQGVGLREGVP